MLIGVMSRIREAENLIVAGAKSSVCTLAAHGEIHRCASGKHLILIPAPSTAKRTERIAHHEAKIEAIEPIENQKRFRGELAGIDGDVISITDRTGATHAIAFSNIHSAKLVLTDRLIASTAPLNSAGADEIDEDNPDQEQED